MFLCGVVLDVVLLDYVDMVFWYFYFGDDFFNDLIVIFMVWSFNGVFIVFGIEIGNKFCFGVWVVDGISVYCFEGFDFFIINFCWSFNDKFFLVILLDMINGLENFWILIQVLFLIMVNLMFYIFNYDIYSYFVDVIWIGESFFIFCG